MRHIIITAVPREAGRAADLRPARGLIAGAGVTFRIDEGLRQEWLHPRALLPVLRERRHGQAQHPTGQIGLPHFRENQEAVVLHEQRQAARARAAVSPEPRFARRRFPSRPCSHHNRQHLVVT